MSTDKQAHRLLRAIGDIDDSYLTDAYEFGQKSDVAGTHAKKLSYKAIFGTGLAVAACLAAALIMHNTIGSKTPISTETSTEFVGSSFQEVSSMEEAMALTGFDIDIPEGIEPYTNTVISVIDENLIDVSYQTEDGDMGYALRKGQTDYDVSGDYNVYYNTQIVEVGGSEVTMKGNGDTVSVAIWSKNGYSYAVCAISRLMSVDEMVEIISQIDP